MTFNDDEVFLYETLENKNRDLEMRFVNNWTSCILS